MYYLRSSLLLIIIQIIVCEADSEVQNYSASNFLSKIHEKCHFVLFIGDRCIHCGIMRRVWENIAKNLYDSGNHDVTLAQVDCSDPENFNLCTSQLIKKCPTIIWYPKELNYGYIYNGMKEEQYMYQMINTACPSMQSVVSTREKLSKYVEAVKAAKLKEVVKSKRRSKKRF